MWHEQGLWGHRTGLLLGLGWGIAHAQGDAGAGNVWESVHTGVRARAKCVLMAAPVPVSPSAACS